MIVLVLLVFFGATCTVNRIAHRRDFERRHRTWIKKHYNGDNDR